MDSQQLQQMLKIPYERLDDLNAILLVVIGAQEIDAPVGTTPSSVKGDHFPVRCPGSPASRPFAHKLPDLHLSDVGWKVGNLQPQNAIRDTRGASLFAV